MTILQSFKTQHQTLALYLELFTQ